MTNTLELARQVIIVCTMLSNNNYSRPTVNLDKIISCNNILNEPLIINKTKQDINNKTTETNNVYIINDSDIKIND